MTDQQPTIPDPTAANNTIIQLFQQWLSRVEGKLDTLNGRLEGKADRSEVADVAARLDAKADKAEFHELRAQVARESDRIDALDKASGLQGQRASDRTEWSRWAWPVVLTLIYTSVSVYAIIHH